MGKHADILRDGQVDLALEPVQEALAAFHKAEDDLRAYGERHADRGAARRLAYLVPSLVREIERLRTQRDALVEERLRP